MGGFGCLRYQKSEGGSMFSMERGLFSDNLTKIYDLTNTLIGRGCHFGQKVELGEKKKIHFVPKVFYIIY